MSVKMGMKVSTSTSTLPAKRQEDEPLLWVWILMGDAGLSQRSLSQCSKTGRSVSTERYGAPSFQPGREQPPFSGLRKRSQNGKPDFPAGDSRLRGSVVPACQPAATFSWPSRATTAGPALRDGAPWGTERTEVRKPSSRPGTGTHVFLSTCLCLSSSVKEEGGSRSGSSLVDCKCRVQSSGQAACPI